MKRQHSQDRSVSTQLKDITKKKKTRSEVIKVVSIQIAVFWNMMPCCLIVTFQQFGETCCHLNLTWRLRKQGSSEMLVLIYYAALCHITEHWNYWRIEWSQE